MWLLREFESRDFHMKFLHSLEMFAFNSCFLKNTIHVFLDLVAYKAEVRTEVMEGNGKYEWPE